MEEENTRYTLIEKAVNLDDEEAWSELYSHYMTFVFHILREQGVGDALLDDVCQQVFIALTKSISSFDRSQGRFRSWFSSVVRNTSYRHFKRQKVVRKYDQKSYELAEQEVEHSDIDAYIEKEWEKYLKSLALERVAKAHRGKAYEVFRLGLEGKSAHEIAEEVGIKVDSVYTLRKRVRLTLTSEFESIRADLELS